MRRTIVGIGRNYVAHARELNNPLPKEPFFFLKPSSSVVASGCPIELPSNVGPVHHEAELAVVIGKTAKKVKGDCYDYIEGYAVAIDVTARALQEEAKGMGMPWTKAKGFDTFCPLGPVVDKSLVKDPHDLVVYLSVNGEERQRASTGLMIFPIPALIEAITDVMTLEKGDVILTGTPAGVAEIVPGDRVVCGIEGLPCDPIDTRVVARK
mmetsp:Transcript_9467/g.15500  ORF Transcript_9467/g.15500 Transcript_9467/m.15500 type:complete len:210 (-) Transcript_9467:2640-3269(-)